MFKRLQEILGTIRERVVGSRDLPYYAQYKSSTVSAPGAPVAAPYRDKKEEGTGQSKILPYVPELNHSVKNLNYERYAFFRSNWPEEKTRNLQDTLRERLPSLNIETETKECDENSYFLRLSVKDIPIKDYEKISMSLEKAVKEVEREDAYFGGDETENEKLRRRIHSAIRLLSKGITAEDISRLDGMLKEYPQFLLYKVDKSEVGSSNQEERKEKAKRLEDLISGNNKCRDNTEESSKTIVSSDITSKYEINFFVPNVDKASKIRDMAKKVGMCWDKDEAKYLSERLEEDMRISGGTVMFSITKEGKYVAVVRSFIGVDAAKRTYLHIDTVEGKCAGVSHHSLETWAKEQPGALKLSILTNLYLAKLIGVDYLSGGDEPVEEVFSYMRFTKVRTAVKGKNQKIGFPANESPEKGDIRVRSYFFDSDKNYALILNPFYRRPSNKNKNDDETDKE